MAHINLAEINSLMDLLKKRFFRYHLSASILFITLIIFTCQFFWFPQPFLQLDGTWIAILTLASIDIILGPLLTLLLVSSKKSKRELSLDMAIIIIIQISALSFGLLQIEKERLVALVHYDGAFHLVPKTVLIEQDENSIVNMKLNKYKGINLAMVLNQTVYAYSQKNSTPFLYDSENYQKLKMAELRKNTVPYHSLPMKIQQQYDKETLFKLLVGKKRSGIIIFNADLTIADIKLIKKH